MFKPLFNRTLAFIIDYGIIMAYAAILFLVTNFLLTTFDFKLSGKPYKTQLIGFITLTFPVITYSYLAEKSGWKGTVGKKLLKLMVVTTQKKLTNRNILLRNILKYLPWEIAHTGIHWTIYYTSNHINPPVWTLFFLIVPQLVVIIYIISIVATKGKRSIYDYISNTQIIQYSTTPGKE